jgi:NAD+ diphosphatase
MPELELLPFLPATEPPAGSSEGPALWFAFKDNRLLVSRQGEAADVPLLSDLAGLGLAPVRRQYLGTAAGIPCFSAELPEDAALPPGWTCIELRPLFGALRDPLFALAGRAFQIMDWDRTHQFCGRCGHPTETKIGERAKSCPRCGLFNFPRVAPAIIAAVVRDRRLLLARARRFPTAMYSVIAGFVEPGESLEECAHREIREETGIGIRNLGYFGSQSWPFPHSLMVAFTAEYAEGEIEIDGTEVVDAGWYGPQELPRIPDRVSIARRLIDWFVASHGADRRP